MTRSQGIQRCIRCDGPTGRTTEDAIQLGDAGPFCEECAERLAAAAPQMLEALEEVEALIRESRGVVGGSGPEGGGGTEGSEGRAMTRDDLGTVLEKHRVWLEDREAGERANLREADLQEANLRLANLREAALREVALREAAFLEAARSLPPGSADAMSLGCTCPVYDNAHGAGMGRDEHGQTVYVMSLDCPLHGGKKG